MCCRGRTIFKFLKAIGVEHKALNFDALEYAPGNQGNILRASVQELTGTVTFPQVYAKCRASPRTRLAYSSAHTLRPCCHSFIGGKFFGGAADACIKWKKGELQPLLEEAGAKPDTEWNGYAGDPFEFLPKCAL